MSKTILVVNTKGGVGKTTIATQVIPALAATQGMEVNVYEIDNNNQSRLNNSKINFSSFRVDDEAQHDDMLFTLLSQENTDINSLHIIDAGGGDDAKSVIQNIATMRIHVDLVIVPVNSNAAQVQNAIDTVNMVREKLDKPEILIILNGCHTIDKKDVQARFAGIFGSEDFGLPNRTKEFGKVNWGFILDTPAFSALELRKVSLFDIIVPAINEVENYSKERGEWVKKGKEYFAKKIVEHRFNQSIMGVYDGIEKYAGIKPYLEE